ncbi:hypothetical protein [Pararhizobium sp. O133]|uniref:hypothetical protein n=1 Tax=Pararhizobium sp. O133 TaxID=3449278 RepID=UPI003F685619
MVAASTVLGAAGEHYVMCQLLRRGLIAALAPVGVPNCDIVVTDDIGDRLCAVQVKTRVEKGSDGGWHMGKKHESIVSDRLFYAFLDFGKTLTDPPSCFLIPSALVADVLQRSYAVWLSTPGKKGQQRKDTDMRRFLPDFDKTGVHIGCGPNWLAPYKEAWNSLVSVSAADK